MTEDTSPESEDGSRFYREMTVEEIRQKRAELVASNDAAYALQQKLLQQALARGSTPRELP